MGTCFLKSERKQPRTRSLLDDVRPHIIFKHDPRATIKAMKLRQVLHLSAVPAAKGSKAATPRLRQKPNGREIVVIEDFEKKLTGNSERRLSGIPQVGFKKNGDVSFGVLMLSSLSKFLECCALFPRATLYSVVKKIETYSVVGNNIHFASLKSALSSIPCETIHKKRIRESWSCLLSPLELEPDNMITKRVLLAALYLHLDDPMFAPQCFVSFILFALSRYGPILHQIDIYLINRRFTSYLQLASLSHLRDFDHMLYPPEYKEFVFDMEKLVEFCLMSCTRHGVGWEMIESFIGESCPKMATLLKQNPWTCQNINSEQGELNSPERIPESE